MQQHNTRKRFVLILICAVVLALAACGGGGSGGSGGNDSGGNEGGSAGEDGGGGSGEDGGGDTGGDEGGDTGEDEGDDSGGDEGDDTGGDEGGGTGGDEGDGTGDDGDDGTGEDGDDGASGPGTPTLSLTPQSIKTFHFTWDDIDGETEYRLLENPDDISGYTEVATIAADNTSHDLEVFLPARINASYILQACNGDGCTDSSPVHVDGNLAAAVGYVKASNTGADDEFGVSVAMAADGQTFAVGASGEASSATNINGDQDNNSAEDAGAVYVFTRAGGAWSQQAYLKASNAEAGDGFGLSVALAADGNTLAVGALGDDSNATGIDGDPANSSADLSGAAYVFTRDGGVWSQEAYVKASNTEWGDRFGIDVALAGDGNTLAVGALEEDGGVAGINGDDSDNSVGISGAVYVFTRNAGAWSQQAYVKASNPGIGDDFGREVALAADGDTLAVGARDEGSDATGIDGDGGNDNATRSGAVYVFTRAGGVWSQQAYVKASNTEQDDLFGVSVALAADGDTLAVGASSEDGNATGIDGDDSDNWASGSGAAYVFTRNGGVWSQQAYVKASNTESSAAFGRSVALTGDGNLLAVGATGEGSEVGSSGAVYVFSRAGVWSQQGYVKAPDPGFVDYFGESIALPADGDTLVAGARWEDSSATGIGGDQTTDPSRNHNSGAVYLY